MREAILALRGLEVHVRDLDALEDSERRSRAQCCSGIVRVDVSLQRGRVADHEQGVAERRQVPLERRCVESVARDDEDGAVAEARGLLMDRIGRDRFGLRDLGERLAGQMGGDPANDLDETGGPSVHDSRLAENLELVAGLRDGLVTSPDELREQLGQLGVVVSLRLLGERAAHGEDRSFDRLSHRGVRRIRATPERGGNRAILGVALDRAADDLGQDHARVAACTEQRGMGDVGLAGLERLADGAHGQEHVRPRVSVRNRVDVEVVQACAVTLEGSLGSPHELEHSVALGHRAFI